MKYLFNLKCLKYMFLCLGFFLRTCASFETCARVSGPSDKSTFVNFSSLIIRMSEISNRSFRKELPILFLHFANSVIQHTVLLNCGDILVAYFTIQCFETSVATLLGIMILQPDHRYPAVYEH